MGQAVHAVYPAHGEFLPEEWLPAQPAGSDYFRFFPPDTAAGDLHRITFDGGSRLRVDPD